MSGNDWHIKLGFGLGLVGFWGLELCFLGGCFEKKMDGTRSTLPPF